MRREVSRYAREMGLQQAGGGTGGDGSGEGSTRGAQQRRRRVGRRTRKLRADIDKSSRERETLQRIALRMQAMPKVVKGG